MKLPIFDFTPIQKVKNRLGDKGIIRSHPFSPEQGSHWQSFCMSRFLDVSGLLLPPRQRIKAAVLESSSSKSPEIAFVRLPFRK